MSSSAVLSLLAERHRSDSQPLKRTDGARLALVLEGGSSRAAYGGGMVAVLEEAGLLPCFDAVYGTSAGALNGAWFTCGRVLENLHGWWDPAAMKRIIRPANLLRGRPVLDGDDLIDGVYSEVLNMGFEQILASPVEYHPIATDAATGESVDLAPLIRDVPTLKAAMKATARVPLLSGGPVELAGRAFIDGGMVENVPAPTALAQGASHVLVVRTKAPVYELASTGRAQAAVVEAWMRKYAPGAAHTWAARNRGKLEIEQLMRDDERVFQVAPAADVPRISMTTSDPAPLRRAVEIGRECMRQALAGTGILGS